jgi:hypothetical protein
LPTYIAAPVLVARGVISTVSTTSFDLTLEPDIIEDVICTAVPLVVTVTEPMSALAICHLNWNVALFKMTTPAIRVVVL